MSTQPNESLQSIDSVRGQIASEVGGLVSAAKRVFRFRAVLLWAAIVCSALLFLICVDMLIRREEFGLRILFFLAWAGCAVVAAYYWIKPAWTFAPTRVDMARWIERAQPELGERLSTAVELAEAAPADERFGSLQFRDAALRGWSALAPRVDWKSYLDHSSWLRALATLGGALLFIFVVAIWRPADVRLAVARLMAPWADLPWPMQDQLQFVNLPKVIASGQELNLEIIDLQAPLPETINLLLRYPESDSPQELITYPAKNMADVALATVPNVDQPIEIRAVGGDDDQMGWQRVDVAQPPKLESFRFKIQPPEYSGRPANEIVGNRIQALVGSRIQFLGRFAEAVQKIEVAKQSKATDSPQETKVELAAVEVSANGRDFEWQVSDEHSLLGVQTWRWKVTARSELTIESPEIWSVELIADAVPVVTLKEQELPQLSPEAALVIKGNATDDLGLVDVSLRWQIEGSDMVEPGKFSLWGAGSGEVSEQREFAVDRTWQLDSSVGLLAGQRLNLWLEAKDSLGQVGKSSTQSLEVREAADVLESIAERQSQLLEQVRAITEAQRRNSQLAARSREIVEQADSVRREEIDALANVAQMQQSVNNQLSAERNSIAESLKTLSQLLENNQLADTEIAEQLKSLSQRIENVTATELTQALSDSQRALEQSKADASANAKPSKALKDALVASEASQNEALAELQGLTDRLAQSEALRVVERELGQVLNQQQSLRRDTDNLELRRLAGMNKEDFQANRAGLQADQQGLAQSVEQLQKRAKALAEAMPAEQAALKSQVEQAIERLTKDQVSSEMRSATDSIANDRFVEATEIQAAVVESLRDALQKLSSSMARNLEGQLGQMRSTATELKELASEQAELAQKLGGADAARKASELGNEQRRLQQQTEDQKSRAGQLGDSQTEQALNQATQSQQSAVDAVENGETATAAKQARDAAKQLADAAKDSEKRAKELEREVAEQQLMQLGAALSQLVSQQQPIVEKMYEASRVQLDVLGEEEKKTAEQDIRQLASRQEAVRQMVRDVRERADKLPAFDWALEQAELDMARAVAAAQRFRIAPDATDSATRALRKLEQAATAMKRPDQKPQSQENSEQPEEKADPDEKSKGRAVPPIASLKLLRGLQSDVNAETKQLSESGSIMAPERAQRLQQLSDQQQALGLQLEQILRELKASMDTNQ
ncbi:MAG: DUF4175 family protein [Pirellulaceae bacterium]|nr:DUF4175 family protein [Pirellulaceae bacterium]